MQSKSKVNQIPEPEGYDEELERSIDVNIYHFWSPEDEATLRRYYGLVKMEVLAQKLGVTSKQIRNKVRDMGITQKEQQLKYSREQREAKD